MNADDPYWSKPCRGCTDIHRTNLECVTETAHNVGISVEEAMRQFVPPATGYDASTRWSQGEWKPDADA